MKRYTRVQSISENNYVVGNRWDDERTISDLVLEDNGDIDIYVKSYGGEEKYVGTILFHAVELVVK